MSWKRKFLLDNIIDLFFLNLRLALLAVIIAIPVFIITLFFGLGMATLEMLGTALLGILGLFLVIAACMLAFNLFAYATIVIARDWFGPDGEEFMKGFWNYVP